MTLSTIDRPIGIFDSGSGGLSVLASIQELLPHESYIYVGDHANNPYGDKTTDFIRQRVVRAIQFFISRHVKLIVIACNTATIAGIDWYRNLFPDMPIVGVVPVIKTAATISKTKHVIVLSTDYTAKSTYQKQLIEKFGAGCVVTSLGSSTLVPLIEQGILHGPEIDKELRLLLSSVHGQHDDVIVLGCTHYPFLKHSLRAMIGTDVQILDSGGAVARQVKRILSERDDLTRTSEAHTEYLTTGDAIRVQSLFCTLLKHEVTVKHIMV